MQRKLEQWENLLRELKAEFLLREEELESLHAIDLRLLEDELFLEETLPFITDRTKHLVRADHASILLRRGQYLEVAYSSDGLDLGQRISIPDSIVGKCLSERKDIFIEDLSNSPLKSKYIPIKGYLGTSMQSLVEVPINFRDETVGVLCVESVQPHAFRQAHIRVMYAIASQVAIALQHLQHFRSAALFADVDRMMIDPGESRQVVEAALERVMSELRKLHRVRISGAQILFLREPDYLEIVHSTGADKGLRVSIDKSICGRAVRERRTVVVGDVSKDPQYRHMLDSPIKSEIALPITLGDDQLVIGVLNVESTEPDAFIGFNQIVLENFADKVRILLAFVKLRADVTGTLEARHANDLLVAFGDQTGHIVHRLNSSMGLMRATVLRLQEGLAGGVWTSGGGDVQGNLDTLLELADKILELPAEMARFFSQGEDNLVDVNRCVALSLEDAAPRAGINVVTELSDKVSEVRLRSFDIVVQNLITNAMDAMPQGGDLYISTDLVSHKEALSGYVQLIVRDTGYGIPEDALPRIFEPEYTTRNSLGFGLWWVRQFVLRSKGEISVDSKLGDGATFTVKIPIENASETAGY